MGDACENESDEVKWGRWLLNCNASLLLISSRSDSLVILIDRESLSSKTWEREREREFVLSCFVSTICLRFTSVGGGGGGGQGASRALVTFNCTLQRQLALCAYIQSLSIGCRMLSHYISTYCTLTHFWLNEKIEQLILNDLTDVATVVVAISCVNVFISLSLYCDPYCDSNSFSFILSNPSTWNETKRCDYSRTSLEMEDVSEWAREKNGVHWRQLGQSFNTDCKKSVMRCCCCCWWWWRWRQHADEDGGDALSCWWDGEMALHGKQDDLYCLTAFSRPNRHGKKRALFHMLYSVHCALSDV